MHFTQDSSSPTFPAIPDRNPSEILVAHLHLFVHRSDTPHMAANLPQQLDPRDISSALLDKMGKYLQRFLGHLRYNCGEYTF